MRAGREEPKEETASLRIKNDTKVSEAAKK